ncbi:hypothetical protein [Enterococcus faecalis]|uniref:hypothetical protein n=1 Tax=Enterococcus faecalis TaxID=1351 RepID=UPI001E43F473|nr:hypothetical protein [Enterococcus faecalis]MCD4978456.1 hypothetical protein [Enterococcus faecalis]
METLHSLLMDYGFSVSYDLPTEKDYQVYFEVCDRLDRDDLDFKPKLGAIYSLQISKFTMLFVEKKIIGDRYRTVKYDFYKERKMDYSKSDVLTVYGENMSYMDIFRYLKGYLRKFEKVRGVNERF